MRRVALLLLAAGFAFLAVRFHPARARPSGDVATALGRSLGGLRVAAVDALFLRAERLRRDGRVEELPALYDAIRSLDPDNLAAIEYLAQVYAYDLLGQAPDADARFSWWKEAWRLIEDALARWPDSPSLLARSGDLLLEVAPRDEGLEARVAALVPHSAREGVRRLLRAAELADALPRRGRLHLINLTFLLPLVAALEMSDGGESWRELVAAGRDVLALRRAAFFETRVPSQEPGAGPFLGVAFGERLDLVEEVGEALDGGDRQRARALIEAWRPRDADPALADALLRAAEG